MPCVFPGVGSWRSSGSAEGCDHGALDPVRRGGFADVGIEVVKISAPVPEGELLR
jgi:hypothetical protein